MLLILQWFLYDMGCGSFLCWNRQNDFYFPPVVKTKKSGNKKSSHKLLKKTLIWSDSEDDGGICQQNTTSDPICEQIVESEKEDQMPISALCGSAKKGDENLKRLIKFYFLVPEYTSPLVDLVICYWPSFSPLCDGFRSLLIFAIEF